MKYLKDGFVYTDVKISDKITETHLVGPAEDERIEGDEKVYYSFDESIGDYVETARQPYMPPAPETDPITALQLAVAELAEMITGGE